MPLIKVRRLACEKPYSYAPSREDALVNVEDIVAVTKTEARGSGPFLRISIRGEEPIVIVGTMDELERQIHRAYRDEATTRDSNWGPMDRPKESS